MGQEVKFCTACGNELHVRAEICPKCGVRQIVRGDGNKKLVAAVLALFLGGLGIHHFYLGNKVRGLIYLLLCWTFIPAIIAFVEGIIFFVMSDASFEAKYC